MSTSIKTLNEVMRNPKTFSQTKALYSYLWVRADSKSGLSYPPKTQILSEVNLTEKLYNQCLAVLINKGYIKETTITKKDKEGKKRMESFKKNIANRFCNAFEGEKGHKIE